MRSNLIRSLSALFALTALAVAGSAHAEDEFDVAVAGDKIVVKTKAGWHINKDYPWKVIAGETKVGKDKFTFAEAEASVVAPKGEAKVRGGICSGAQCRSFEKTVTVK